jgi:hypothetical protein
MKIKKEGFRQAKILLVVFILIVTLAMLFQYSESKLNLSDLQIEACNAADSAGTCESRLSDLGIVLEGECCKALKQCC